MRKVARPVSGAASPSPWRSPHWRSSRCWCGSPRCSSLLARIGWTEDGSPSPGTWEQVESPLTFGEALQQLVLAPITGEPLWFDPGWWFPQSSMVFLMASVLVGVVARLHEKDIVRLISAGASDMMGPAMVVLPAGGVSVRRCLRRDEQHADPRHDSQRHGGSGFGGRCSGFRPDHCRGQTCPRHS